MKDVKVLLSEMTNSVDTANCAASEPYALRIVGDSMEPEFPDGCIIIIDPASTAKHNSYIIAELPELGYICRQLVIENERHLLKAVNSGYKPIEIEGTQVIRGVIVQKAGTRRQQRKHYT